MNEPVSVARQATFSTEPADSATASGGSVRRGDIHLPIVEDIFAETESNCAQNHISSGNSSPIYATGGPTIQQFTEDVINSQPPRSTKAPSTCGDSSELEILSDVGLAGDDSDSDVPPLFSLSLAAKKKVRKEPRIKVPSTKFDSAEPTIQEETTQEVLSTKTPLQSESELQVPPAPGLQTNSIIKTSYSEGLAGESSKVSVASQNGKDHSKQLAFNSEKHCNVKQKRKSNETYTLDSSFCESDWQPKHRKNSLTYKFTSYGNFNTTDGREAGVTLSDKQNIEKDGHLHKNTNIGKFSSSISVAEDKQVISNKYQTDVKPIIGKRLDVGRKWAKGVTSSGQKRPRSSGDEKRRKPVEPSQRRSLEERRCLSVTQDVETNVVSVITVPNQSRPLILQATPIFSDFIEPETDASIVSDWNNDSVSGVPKRGRLLKHSVPHEHVTNEDPSKKEQLSKNSVPHAMPQIKNLDTSGTLLNVPNIPTMDGYDYESETFEEVLKERNAMVKAERTYQKRIKQLEDELKAMVSQCQSLSDENKELRKTLDDMKKSKEESTKKELSDNVSLATRIAGLETEKENLSNENEKLATKVKEYETKMKHWDSIFVENTKLKSRNGELEKKVHELERQVETISNQAKTAGSETESKILTADIKNQELQAVVADLQYENKALKAKLKSLEQDNRDISETLEVKRKELNEVLRAMKNETTTESELKESKLKLDSAQGEINSVKQELEEMKQMLKSANENTSKLQGSIYQKDMEIKRMKLDHDNKDKLITDLRRTLDKNRQEIHRYQESQNAVREIEKDTLALKSRIGSLRAEIESSLVENQRLKQEREELIQQVARLSFDNASNADAVTESKKYFRKWENERDLRNKAEIEIAKKQEEIQILDSRLKEANNKINVIHSRVKVLEDEKTQFQNLNVEEVHTNNKIMKDENKKLRQMLVERNIELTNKKTEQQAFDSKIRLLERKQNDAEVRIQQLSGWVGDMDKIDSKAKVSVPHNNAEKANTSSVSTKAGNSQLRHSTRASISQHLPPRLHNEISERPVEPKVAYVSPRSRKTGYGSRKPPSTMTPPPEWEDSKRYGGLDGHNHTPVSLPLILDTKSITPPDPHGGYFTMYKQKLKRIQERRF